MCKYCDDLKKDGEANLCASTNDMGVLGQADMVTRIVDYGNDRFVLKTLGMPFTAFNSLSYPFVRIEFCPMCGRKLVEECSLISAVASTK